MTKKRGVYGTGRWLAILSVVMVLCLLGTSVVLADGSTGEYMGGTYIKVYGSAGDVVWEPGHAGYAGAMKFRLADDSIVPVFCTDIHHGVGYQYTASGEVMDCRIRWLMEHYPPEMPTSDWAHKVEMAARQMAVWHFSDGFIPASDSNGATRAWEIINAVPEDACAAVAPDVSIRPASVVNPVGTAQTFTVTVMQGGVPVANTVVDLAATHGQLSVDQVTTDENGAATFTLEAGAAGTAEIEAQATLPLYEGTVFVGLDNPDKQKLVLGQQTPGLVFGNATSSWEFDGSITAFSFNDANMNGQHDEGEPFLEGWVVQLEGDQILSNQTDDSGRVVFNALPDGVYDVSQTLQDGWYATTPQTYQVTVDGNVHTLYFGQIKTPVIVGEKFNDADMDGQWDDGESPLSGWELQLFRADGSAVVGMKGNTDAEGRVVFSSDRDPADLLPGTYYVRETLQAGWFASTGISKSVTVDANDVVEVPIGNYQSDEVPADGMAGIDVIKTGPAYAHKGDTITYQFAVENSGEVQLDNVALTDPMLGGEIAACAADQLGVGESLSCQVTYQVSQGAADPLENTATATASYGGEGAGGGCTFGGDCFQYEFLGATTNPDGSVTLRFSMVNLCGQGTALSNVAFSLPEGIVPVEPEGTYTSPNGNQYNVESPTNNPFYSIKFETIGEGIRDGAEDIFEYTLPAGAYDPSQTIQIQAKGGQTTELVSFVPEDCTGQGGAGGSVSDSDSHTIDILNPGIDIEATGPAEAHEGDTVTYAVTVENTGDATLDVVVPLPDGSEWTGTLAAGETAEFTADAIVPADQDPFEVTFTATGTDVLGGSVSDSDAVSCDVLNPGIDIEATGPAEAHEGDTVTYAVTVENNGDATLDVVVPLPDGSEWTGTLAAGETAEFTADAVVPADQDPFEVTFTATGTDALGGSVSDEDMVSVDVINPAIAVAKTASAETVYVGETVTYTYAVTNPGDDALIDVSVSDDKCAPVSLVEGDADGDQMLDPGETWTYICAATLTEDTTNIATASGTDALGGSVSDQAQATVTVEEEPIQVIDPSIKVEETVTPDKIHSGEMVVWEITVTNDGQDPLTDVTVTDGNSYSYGEPFDLAIGESRTFQYTSTPNADTVNPVSAAGLDPLGGSVSDSASAEVQVIHPAIEVVKTASVDTYIGGEESEPVDWTITVYNRGDTTLYNVVVTDSNGMSFGPLTLPSGDGELETAGMDEGASNQVSWTYSTFPTQAVTNVAVASGTDELGLTVTDSDEATVQVQGGQLAIEKTSTFSGEGEGGMLEPGGWVEYQIVVTNDGAIIQHNVVLQDPIPTGTSYITDSLWTDGDAATYVTDAAVPYVEGMVTTLSPGQSFSLAFRVQVSEEFTEDDNPLINTAEVSSDELPDPVSASTSDEVVVSIDDPIYPEIQVIETVEPAVVYPGEEVTWHVVVTNVGDDPLTGVTLSDDAGNDYGAAFDLAVGASKSFSFVSYPNATTINEVVATGQDSQGGNVSAQDSATVRVINPGIQVTETVTPSKSHSGESVTWVVVVTNTGDDPLQGVTLVDDNGHDYGAPFGLAVGQSKTLRYTTQPTVDTINAVMVTGLDTLGGQVGDSASAEVQMIHPAIEVVKTASVDTYVGGEESEPVDWTITVYNRGDTTLYNVVVTDSNGMTFGPVTLPVATSGEGEGEGDTSNRAAWKYATYPSQSVTNVALASGTDELGLTVTDSDEATVQVQGGQLSIEKIAFYNGIAEGGELLPGGWIEYEILVTNEGQVAQHNVVIRDPIPNGTSYIEGSLSTNGDEAVYVSEEGGDYVKGRIATLWPGQSFSVILQLQVSEIFGEDDNPLVNVAEASSDELPDPVYASVSNVVSLSTDTDGDGIPDGIEGGDDADGDGTPDFMDDDSDDDGILDAIEGDDDADGDGTPNFLDDDSDDDGILDQIEGDDDADGDGTPNFLDNDSDGDGIPDGVDGADDADGDGTPNFLDNDSDGDGILDDVEGDKDADGDGTPNFLDDDSDDDGILDVIEGAEDADGDGTPNFLDDDSDGDGIPDAVEGADDADGDGTPNFLDSDSDGDGIPDAVEGADDADGDGTPNSLDSDSDGDSIPDSVEAGDDSAHPVDSDDDGVPDYIDTDDDGDGIPTVVEYNDPADADDDFCSNILQDSDGDGIPDCQDNNVDGDTLPNYLDPDSDGDSIPDEDEYDADGDGIPDDKDGDGIPDWLEPAVGMKSADSIYHVYLPFYGRSP